MQGFFPQSLLVAKAPASLIPKCGACKLFEGCNSPKMEYSGKGIRKILIVAEAPGEVEDIRGKQFVGRTGQYLESVLHDLGVNMRKDCWLTNSIICRPPDNKTPTEKQIDYCRPNLIKTVQELQPETIILLGKPSVKSLLGSIWKEDIGAISKWAGWVIPCTKPNAWICPTFHPSYIMRLDNEVAHLWFKRHLKAAISKEGRPWKVIPNYEPSIKRILSSSEAAKHIGVMMSFNKPLAFDYETNMLKPYNKKAEIVCCSLSDGISTIAFPWQGEAVKAMRVLLRSGVPMIASNKKFEDCWTYEEFGFMVDNWFWCSMIGAHWRDARKGITSVKFQAFVRLGAMSYDNQIRPFLKGVKGSKVNRIREIDIQDLLLYCGMDSLLEYKVAMLQRKEGGL